MFVLDGEFVVEDAFTAGNLVLGELEGGTIGANKLCDTELRVAVVELEGVRGVEIVELPSGLGCRFGHMFLMESRTVVLRPISVHRAIVQFAIVSSSFEQLQKPGGAHPSC